MYNLQMWYIYDLQHLPWRKSPFHRRRFASGGKGGDSRPESTLLHSSDLGRSAGSQRVFGIQGVKRNALKKVAEFYGLKYRYIYSISIGYL
jgi:hypothetical protein